MEDGTIDWNGIKGYSGATQFARELLVQRAAPSVGRDDFVKLACESWRLARMTCIHMINDNQTRPAGEVPIHQASLVSRRPTVRYTEGAMAYLARSVKYVLFVFFSGGYDLQRSGLIDLGQTLSNIRVCGKPIGEQRHDNSFPAINLTFLVINVTFVLSYFIGFYSMSIILSSLILVHHSTKLDIWHAALDGYVWKGLSVRMAKTPRRTCLAASIWPTMLFLVLSLAIYRVAYIYYLSKPDESDPGFYYMFYLLGFLPLYPLAIVIVRLHMYKNVARTTTVGQTHFELKIKPSRFVILTLASSLIAFLGVSIVFYLLLYALNGGSQSNFLMLFWTVISAMEVVFGPSGPGFSVILIWPMLVMLWSAKVFVRTVLWSAMLGALSCRGGEINFKFRPGPFIFMGIQNMLLVILSFGLLFPYANVRAIRQCASHCVVQIRK